MSWIQAWTRSVTPLARVIWPLTTELIAGRTAVWHSFCSTWAMRAALPAGKRELMSETIWTFELAGGWDAIVGV